MKRLELLDYGRFFAVVVVVLFHYTFNGIANGKISSIAQIPAVVEFTKYGYLGVEFFFMISGYVIFFSARNATASKFAVSRALRLYPAYWCAILFTSFFALLWGGSMMAVSPLQILANFSMLQVHIGIDHVDGVYWTLVYELSFYTAIFFLLFCGLRDKLASLITGWPLLFIIAVLLNHEDITYMGGFYYYFCAGALFAILKEKITWPALFSLLTTYAFCIHFSTGNVEKLMDAKNVEYSATVVGVLITLFFMLFAFQNTRKAQTLSLPMSKLAGALTYPVYLIHAHFGYMFISKFATEENKIFIYILTFFIVFLVALFIHKVIEVRLSHIWKELFNLTLGRVVDFSQSLFSGVRIPYGSRIR